MKTETSGIDCVVFENVFYASPEIFQIFHHKFSINVELLLKFGFKDTKVLLPSESNLHFYSFSLPEFLREKDF